MGLLPLPHLPRLVQAPLLGRRGLGHQHVAVGGDMSLGGTDPPCTAQVHPRHGHAQEEERDQEEDLDRYRGLFVVKNPVGSIDLLLISAPQGYQHVSNSMKSI